MNRPLRVTILVVSMAAAGLCGAALRQPGNPGPSAPPSKAEKQTFMELLQRRGGPAPQHELLAPLVGDFDCEISLWTRPGAAPILAKATATGSWILGKRFVQISNTPAAGEALKIESMQVFGFDRRSSRFFCWAVDSTDTYSLLSRGTRDKETGTLTLMGTDEVPGKAPESFKQVIRPDGNDKYTSEVWVQAQGVPGADVDGWFKTVQLVYTRKAK